MVEHGHVFISFQSGNADGVWTHDKFNESGLGGARKVSGPRVTAGGGSAKITISNLHYGVSDADIMVCMSLESV